MKYLFVFPFLLFAAAVGAQPCYVTTSDSVKLYVNVKGEGTPCLYLHGGPGSGSYWLEKFSGPMLEKHFKMIYLDQRGVARSSSPSDGNYSMERMVKDFEEVRGALGIDRWLILGHSFGGILQMGYEKACSDRIAGLIFINCTLCMDDSFNSSWLNKAIEIAGSKTPDKAKDTSLPLFERMGAISNVLGDDMWRLFYADKKNNERMDETFREIPNWNNDFSNAALTVKDYWHDFRPESSEVQQPVLFFYGKTDWAIGPDHHKGVAFPNMLKVGCNVGHVPFLEAPDELSDAINSYCKRYKL